MTTARHDLRRGAVALAGLALLLAAGCSSSDTATEADQTSTLTPTTVVAPSTPQSSQPRQACTAATLGAAAVAIVEAPALVDVVCETDYATATVTNGPGGELVALFTLEGGVWVLTGNAAVAEAASAAPAGFSATAVPAWQRLRDARLAREANPDAVDRIPEAGGPSSTRVSSNGDVEICTQSAADAVTCVPSTLAPPDIIDIPEDPDAPPTTATQSGFCKYNYNDPLCVADPGYTP